MSSRRKLGRAKSFLFSFSLGGGGGGFTLIHMYVQAKIFY